MSSDISHAVQLLIERAPAADAADDVVERWGIYVVKLLVLKSIVSVSFER